MSDLRFPLFIDLNNQTVVVVGGGKIARRRIGTLLQFGARVIVISPQYDAAPGGVQWRQKEFALEDLDGATIAVAATDQRAVNHAVYEAAQQRGIPVSVADCATECTFYFPAVCMGEKLVAGVVSDGSDHALTARAAKRIRQVLEELE